MSKEDYIERLAEINCANAMTGISDELRDERRIIVNYLKVMEVIELDEGGGFHFIGKDSSINKELYLDTFKNW